MEARKQVLNEPQKQHCLENDDSGSNSVKMDEQTWYYHDAAFHSHALLKQRWCSKAGSQVVRASVSDHKKGYQLQKRQTKINKLSQSHLTHKPMMIKVTLFN